MQRLVVKIGTNIVSDPILPKLSEDLNGVIKELAYLHHQNKQIVLVSSGAVGLGSKELNYQKSDLLTQQAFAAIGQSILMNAYREKFKKYGISIAQILVTEEDFSNRKRYLNLQGCLNKLLSFSILPIVNENDVLSLEELKPDSYETKSFGDNDCLSGLFAAKIGANLLILLSNTNGLFSKDPIHYPNALPLRLISHWHELDQIQNTGSSLGGRGGGKTKIKALKIAAQAGVMGVVANGRETNVLSKIFDGLKTTPPNQEGITYVLPETSYLSHKKRWIYSAGSSGKIIVNEGAYKALLLQGASLLPYGIISIKGYFLKNEIVQILNPAGQTFAKGVCHYGSEDIKKLQDQQSNNFSRKEVVHRNNLVLVNLNFHQNLNVLKK